MQRRKEETKLTYTVVGADLNERNLNYGKFFPKILLHVGMELKRKAWKQVEKRDECIEWVPN